ncbi:MAG: hypothetical protein BWY32_02921 [bacterium ADurb.Bin243]|nr:MAG: hypothetical protein BWY32_02921 [bacterium ADurb.Bin243]HOD39073.1 hypothetical protein [Candidatus Wallbacteria bacterium]
MAKTFDYFIDEFDKFTNSEDQESLLDILKRKLAEKRRDEILADCKQAVKDYKAGKCQSGTVDDLIYGEFKSNA